MKFDRVWIIDDSEIDVLVNKRLMELTSFADDITVFYSAEKALDALNNECSTSDHVPDLIFLDMNLSGMDGYEFISAFAALPDYIGKKTKILVVSVFHKQEQLAKVLSYPFVVAQLDKPMTRQALEGVSKELCGN